MFVDSPLSVHEVATQASDEIPRELVDFPGDEDEGIDGFGCENACAPGGGLEPFVPKLATLYWLRWDGRTIE